MTDFISPVRCMVTIVDRGKGDRVVDLCRARHVAVQLVMLGHGTASAEVMDYLGLDEPEKDIVLSLVPGALVAPLLADLTLQFLLSWFCARSQSADTLIVCSFFIGFLKGFLMLWCIRRIKTIFSPKDVRSEFYAYFYPLVFGCGQLSMIITAELAYHHDWKYMYYLMMNLLLADLIMVAI